MTEADGMVFVVDDDPLWGACFVPSDYASKSSPRLRISCTALPPMCLPPGAGSRAAGGISALKRRHSLRRCRSAARAECNGGAEGPELRGLPGLRTPIPGSLGL